MTLNKIRINVTPDPDEHFEGYHIEVLNTVSKKKREYRADVITGKLLSYIFYREDMKPTTRTHEVIDAPMGIYEWVDNRAESLAQGVI